MKPIIMDERGKPFMIPKSKLKFQQPNHERWMLMLFPLVTLTMLTVAIIALWVAKTFIMAPGQ